MIDKICPLMSVGLHKRNKNDEVALIKCQKELCAWYNGEAEECTVYVLSWEK